MSKSDSRERFIRSTAQLLHERGYSATSLGDIVAASGSPKGSLYLAGKKSLRPWLSRIREMRSVK